MSDGKKLSGGGYSGPKTPIPVSDIEIATVVARIDYRTKEMIDKHLPRIESVASKAQGDTIMLDKRVTKLEVAPIPDHACKETERQRRQDDDIIKEKDTNIVQDEKIDNLSSFKRWLIGIVVVVVLTAGGFAVATRSITTENTTNISSNRGDIERHENIIQELPRTSDIKSIVNDAVSKVPRNVTKQIAKEAEENQPTVDEVQSAAETLPLREHELRQLRIILDRAKERENGNSE